MGPEASAFSDIGNLLRSERRHQKGRADPFWKVNMNGESAGFGWRRRILS